MADRRPVEWPTDEEWERFWSRVRGLGKGGCEEWIGGTFSKGYGAFAYRGSPRRAHRVAYVWLHGEPATILDHHCDNRLCVRAHPDHVWPSTPRENVLRGDGPTALNARKTRPDCGHAERFTYMDPRGWRGCRKCRTEAVARYNERNRDAINAKKREARQRKKEARNEQ